MNRFAPHILMLGLALGACAAPPAAERPTPRAPATAEAAPASAAAAADATAVLERWWLLDAERDRVAGIGADRAYAELLAGLEPRRTVVVAIIDSGADIAHEDLDDNVWVNPGEVAGNGIDDDGNGYVDDVHGWNFIGGPDGRSVVVDTWEVARLYGRDRGRFDDADADTLRPAVRAEYDRWLAIAADFRAEREEAEELLARTEELDRNIELAFEILRQQLGTDSLDVDAVRAIQSPRLQVLQARRLFLRLDELDITPAMVDEQLEALRRRLEYHLDPEFDPRHIVGDDYDDVSERYYGNPDVRGPAGEAEHGTHVAGIVGAERDNGVGIDGIAPAVRLMIVRAVPDGDERDKDVANAIRYAVDNGAHIINMSFGKAYSPRKDVVDEAVRYADARGVLMIHAAGNDAADIDSVPNYPTRFYAHGGAARHWIEVAASSPRADERLPTRFTNFGRERVDVFAPGLDILSTVEDGYETNDGTSMAAPVVAGVAALLMSYFPELDAAQVRRIILESATSYRDLAVVPPGGDEEDEARVAFGRLSATGGVVDVVAAVRMALSQAAATR